MTIKIIASLNIRITNHNFSLSYPYQYSCFLVNKVDSIIFLYINFYFFNYSLII